MHRHELAVAAHFEGRVWSKRSRDCLKMARPAMFNALCTGPVTRTPGDGWSLHGAHGK